MTTTYTTTQLKGNVVLSSDTASTTTIGNTTGNITIGAAQTTGQISIGLLATRTGDINIGNNIEGGIVKIANNMSATSTASIQAGTTNKGTHYYRGATVNICDDGGNVNIGTSGGAGTVTVNGTTNINATGGLDTTIGTTGTGQLKVRGNQLPLVVTAPTQYGARFQPTDAQNNQGNISLSGCFPSIPGDIGPRRVCDIYGGFGSNAWGTEFMSIGVGRGGATNDGAIGTPTIEQMRISGSTITVNKPITPSYLPSTITSTQIGYTVRETLTGGNLVSGTEKRIMADKTLPAGKWLICYTACLISDANSVVTLSKAYGFDFTNDWDGINIDSGTRTITSGASGGLTFTGSFVLTSDGTEQYNVAVNITYSTGTMSYRTTAVSGVNSKVTRTRIA